MALVWVCEGIYYYKNQLNMRPIHNGGFYRENRDELIINDRNIIDASAIGEIPVATEQSEPTVVPYDDEHVVAVGRNLHLFKITSGRAVQVRDPLEITGDITGTPGTRIHSVALWCVNGTKLADLAKWRVIDVGVKLTEIVHGTAIFTNITGDDVYIMFGNEWDSTLVKFSNCAYSLTCVQNERELFYEIALYNRETHKLKKCTFKPDGTVKSQQLDTFTRDCGASTSASANTSASTSYSNAYGLGASHTHAQTHGVTRELPIVSHSVASQSGMLRVTVTAGTGDEYTGQCNATAILGDVPINTAINRAFYGVNGASAELRVKDNVITLVFTAGNGDHYDLNVYRSYQSVSRPPMTTTPTTPTPTLAFCTISGEHGYTLECTNNGKLYRYHMMKMSSDLNTRAYNAMYAVEVSDPYYDITTSVTPDVITVTVKKGVSMWIFPLRLVP